MILITVLINLHINIDCFPLKYLHLHKQYLLTIYYRVYSKYFVIENKHPSLLFSITEQY